MNQADKRRMRERCKDLWVWLPLRPGWKLAVEECEAAELFREIVEEHSDKVRLVRYDTYMAMKERAGE